MPPHAPSGKGEEAAARSACVVSAAGGWLLSSGGAAAAARPHSARRCCMYAAAAGGMCTLCAGTTRLRSCSCRSSPRSKCAYGPLHVMCAVSGVCSCARMASSLVFKSMMSLRKLASSALGRIGTSAFSLSLCELCRADRVRCDFSEIDADRWSLGRPSPGATDADRDSLRDFDNDTSAVDTDRESRLLLDVCSLEPDDLCSLEPDDLSRLFSFSNEPSSSAFSAFSWFVVAVSAATSASAVRLCSRASSVCAFTLLSCLAAASCNSRKEAVQLAWDAETVARWAVRLARVACTASSSSAFLALASAIVASH
mmetsp:Transcript_32830/g.82420  ORF Transcript_32830/g.82420 Transcript_32830/m.82420 type:complete len:312 (+) Transcript_32830:191-1126(+)